MSDLLSNEQLLAPDELPSAGIVVPEWGGGVKVRRLSAVERDRFDAETQRIRDADGEVVENLRARLVAHCLVDADGKQRFLRADAKGRLGIDPAAVKALGEKDGRGLARVYRVAAELNGYDDDDEDDSGN